MKKKLLKFFLAVFTASALLTSCSKDEDTSGPVISLAGDETLTYSLPATANGAGTWTDPGATATDDNDGNVSANISTSGTVDLNRKGTYTITYTVSDAAG